MKNRNMMWIMVLTVLAAQPAFAISEAYRAQLERSGCTQVSEANGTCRVDTGRRHHDGAPDSQERNARRQQIQALDSQIAGDYQGEAVDYMEETGWHAINDEHTRWKKAGIVVQFDMSPSGRVAGVLAQ